MYAIIIIENYFFGLKVHFPFNTVATAFSMYPLEWIELVGYDFRQFIHLNRIRSDAVIKFLCKTQERSFCYLQSMSDAGIFTEGNACTEIFKSLFH